MRRHTHQPHLLYQQVHGILKHKLLKAGVNKLLLPAL
jgi:hypothetical protein